MYQIAICDDEPQDRAIIRRFAEQALLDEKQPYRITEYGAPDALLQALRQAPGCCDLVLLDVMFPEPCESGVDFARRLRQGRLDVSIILISASPEYILDGYGVQAAQYLLKPFDPEELRAAILYDLHNRFHARALTLSTRRGQISVRQNSILYLESRGHTVFVHLCDGQSIPVSQKLSELERQLDSRCFCSCHKSFCVNLNHAARLQRYRVTLLGGVSAPVSKQKFDVFREAFIRFSSY